jgi:hypothetical protein
MMADAMRSRRCTAIIVTMVFPAAHEGSLEAVSVQISDG